MRANSDKGRRAEDTGGKQKASGLPFRPHGPIDVHTHGFGAHDTRNAGADTILALASAHGAHGVSAILPTIYPASIEEMRADMAAVKKAMERQGVERSGKDDGRLFASLTGTMDANSSPISSPSSLIAGVHLEGPFINPSRQGALNGALFLQPTARSFRKLIEGFEGIVRIITIAPELKGATKLIKGIVDMGIIASMGHSDATYTEAEAGFRAGAKGITHIFNAMRGIHHREPGIAGFGLLNKEIYIEIIADPFHLDTRMIELIFGTKDPRKILIVSDTVKAAKSASASHRGRNREGMLAGGSMTVTESARRLIGKGLGEKVVMDCINRNPARYLNL